MSSFDPNRESAIIWLLAAALACLGLSSSAATLIWPRAFYRKPATILHWCLVILLAFFFMNHAVLWLYEAAGSITLLAVEVGTAVLLCGICCILRFRVPPYLRSSVALLLASFASLAWLAVSIDYSDGDEIARQIANHDAFHDTGYEQYVRKAPRVRAETDLGNPIAVGAFMGSPEVTENYRRLGAAMEAKFANAIIRVGPQDSTYSCHGWTFAGGRYHILGDSVEQILRENGYRQVVEPREGDVIIYRDLCGKITHSGIVRTANGQGLVLIESKWSILGRYLHAPEIQVYSQDFTYYRSSRRGHVLAGLGSSVPSLPVRVGLQTSAEAIDGE